MVSRLCDLVAINLCKGQLKKIRVLRSTPGNLEYNGLHWPDRGFQHGSNEGLHFQCNQMARGYDDRVGLMSVAAFSSNRPVWVQPSPLPIAYLS